MLKPSRFFRSIVRARVLLKSAVRNYDGVQHQFFFFDISDGSAMIRVKAFDDQCSRICNCVVVGKVTIATLVPPLCRLLLLRTNILAD